MNLQAHYFADPITRADLETAAVFAAFERPHTAAGEAALRERLGTPLLELREIRASQDGIRDCAKTIATWRPVVERARPERVHRYLTSQLEVPRPGSGLGGFVSSAWTAARHPECVAIAREGRECVSELVASCRDWTARSAAAHESRALKDDRQILEEFTARIAARLENCGSSATGLLKLDGLLRGDLHLWIGTALRSLAELDATHALAATIEARGWTFPVLTEGAPRVVIEGLRHPLVESAVENDADLAGDHRVLLLTGPNMAGKTTYMKAVGLSLYLAHVGMGVPARRMETTMFDRLITVIGNHESVASGSSAFHYEVSRLGSALGMLLGGRRCLLLFDELMRGTNAGDAQEACRRVIDGLLDAGNCCAVLSTHVAGLVDVFATEPRLTLGHFHAEMKDDALAYDFRLRSGGYTGRMAMALLDQMGVTAKLASLQERAAVTPAASST